MTSWGRIGGSTRLMKLIIPARSTVMMTSGAVRRMERSCASECRILISVLRRWSRSRTNAITSPSSSRWTETSASTSLPSLRRNVHASFMTWPDEAAASAGISRPCSRKGRTSAIVPPTSSRPS
jgi:hypothetical protein